MSKQIKLTRGMVAIVDDEDFERINAHKWYASEPNPDKFYAARFAFRKEILMHREIMNAPTGIEVDHVRTGSTLDNRKSNLRLCTHSQNMFNRTRTANNASGFKGVCWTPRSQRWRVQIKHNGKKIHVGYFDTTTEAARAYNEAAKKYHGEFARLNEI